ncbi:DUF6049 family protein [Homoserinibacter sp. GY 40078]|uniref:DUF6049 family protein n=1 Tax=Homoserinibacter sp. GY 40078 TaxID=2603275 RepID=UPI0011C8C603|nr:DUF6049 family protein [Homoserinibacter sp. GY 40078]TXK18930.1 hypothetical protein FVQ89_03060 [Homoserinibacter sp. GY 40078]
MPVTTRRVRRALLSATLAAAVASAVAAPAWAASPGDEGSSTTPTSTGAVSPGSGPLSVSVLMPVIVPPTTTGLIPADDLERYTDDFGLLTRQLDAVIGTPATIGVDPMILVSIRVLGTSAPESALQWLQRLESVPNEVFTLAYADADIISAVRTSTLADVTPSGFDFALDPGDFVPAETPEPTEPTDEPSDEPSDGTTPAANDPSSTPTPSDDPGADQNTDADGNPIYPTTEQLLAWTSTLPSIAWPGDEMVAARDLDALADAGYADVVVTSSAVGDPDAPLVTLDGIDGIVVDGAISQLLRTAADTLTLADRTDALTELQSALASARRASPGRGIVLSLAREWPYATSSLPEALAAIESSDDAQLVPLADILDTTAVSATLQDSSDDSDREAVFTELASDADAETTFSSVLSDPSALLDPRRLERIALYSVGWSANDEEWADAVAEFRDRSADIVSSVRIEQGSDVLQLARSSGFRVSVSNSLDLPVTVTVSIDPQGPLLQSDGPVDLTVEPGATATANFPVEAVANGEVLVLTAVSSPTGVPLDSGFARVTVRAEWENIGTALVIGFIALVFGGGIVRLVVVRRRAAAEGRTDD